MRARLGRMISGEEFHFICDGKMADKIERIILLNGGEITAKDARSYGVVISIRKK